MNAKDGLQNGKWILVKRLLSIAVHVKLLAIFNAILRRGVNGTNDGFCLINANVCSDR